MCVKWQPMLRTRKPLAVVISIGLAVILSLLARSVWSQTTYDHFLYVPLVVRPDPPTPTPTPPGWIGFYALHGQVKSNATPAAPLTNVAVSYTRFSLVYPLSAEITHTDASGVYTFALINIHDTDSINISAQAEGFAPQQVSRTGIGLRFNPPINFVLIPVTPTAKLTLCTACR